MSVKITQFEAENVKRIKALTLTPAPTGLTVIGGRNNQGKTSGLDAIVWALEGDHYRSLVSGGRLGPQGGPAAAQFLCGAVGP